MTKRKPAPAKPARRERLASALCWVFERAGWLKGSELLRATRGGEGEALLRQLAVYLAHVETGASQAEVGHAFARDRSTIAHAVRLWEDLRDEDAPNGAAIDEALRCAGEAVRFVLLAGPAYRAALKGVARPERADVLRGLAAVGRALLRQGEADKPANLDPALAAVLADPAVRRLLGPLLLADDGDADAWAEIDRTGSRPLLRLWWRGLRIDGDAVSRDLDNKGRVVAVERRESQRSAPLATMREALTNARAALAAAGLALGTYTETRAVRRPGFTGAMAVIALKGPAGAAALG